MTTDVVPPTVTLSADKRLIAIPVGGSYTADAGATATDEVSGNVTSSITNDSSTAVNLAVAGTYIVTYSAKDAANNTGTATQTVVVHPVGTFASQYNSVAAPGLFNGWANDGSKQNRLFKYENFKWRLLFYFDSAQATEYLVTANGGYGIKWGVGGVRGAGNANLSSVVTGAGWYKFELDELTDTASLAVLAATPDVDGDGLPDIWESFFGAQISPTPLSDLDKDVKYNEAIGGTKTALQAYQTGDNPVSDAILPTVSLAPGVSKLTWVATNSVVTLSTNDIVASDNVTTSNNIVRNIYVNLQAFDPGIGTFDTSSDALVRVTYEVIDQAFNASYLDRAIVVGDPEWAVSPGFADGYRKIASPTNATSISTLGSATVYGQVYVNWATPGTGQAPNITAELGVIASNAITGLVTENPSTWTGTGIWRPATYNTGGPISGDDEYQSTINGSELTAGNYLYAYRFKLGDGSWRYAGVGGPWGTSGANTYGNGTLTVTAAQVRNVTFAVNMGVQRELGNFNPVSDKVYLVGDAVGDWATGVEMLREGSTDVFKITRAIEGALGTTLNYKFKSGNGAVGNNGYEGDVNPDPLKDVRVLTLGAVDSPQDEGTVFFNNVSQVRSLTFKVDMGVQISKGQFAHGDTLEVRFGDFNAGGKSLTREGSTTVYSGTFPVAGDAGGNFQYKFWRTNAVATTQFERVDAPRNNDYLNRSYTLGANGQAATISPTPFFSNDDGNGPVITLKGANPLNLANGATYSDPGATAADVAEGTSVDITGTGPVNPSVAGSYTVTYSASDAAGNTATKTRTVVVAAADPLADYMAGFNLTGANAAGTADPDGDGIDNNAELAFGTDPTNGASRAATLATGTGTIKLVYLQRNSGVTYTVKSFTDLSTPFDSGGTAVTPTATSPQPAGIRADYTQYEASLSTGSTRGFLRVKAVR